MGLQFKLREVRGNLMERDLSRGGEGVSHVDRWRRVFYKQGTVSAKALG